MGLGKSPGLECNVFAGTVGQLVEDDRLNEALVLSESVWSRFICSCILDELSLTLHSADGASRDGQFSALPTNKHRQPRMHTRSPRLGPAQSKRPPRAETTQ